MKKIMSVLLVLSMLLAMIILPVTAEGVEDISATVHFAEQWQGYSDALAVQDKGVLTNNLSATNGTKFMVHSDAPFTYKRMMCSCADGIECTVLAAMKAADLQIKYTKNGDMLNITFADEVKNWGGADHNCVYATAIPTAKAIAGAVVEGAMWYESDGHKTEEYPFAFTLVEGSSHVVNTDLNFANNFGGGVLPAMNVLLASGKTMSVAMCTTWWTEGQYSATPTELTPVFTQGEGLVTMNLANAAYPEIWSSADCTYLNIVPTDAGRAITEDTVVAGSCTIINRYGTAVPLQFTITLTSSMDYQEWGIADAWTAMAERMLAMAKPTPITHTFNVNKDTVGFKTILHSSWHFTKCICGAENCEQMGNINNLKSRVDVGADLVTLSFEKVYNEAWAQDCTYITLTLTEAAKQASGTFPVEGVFYYESEDGSHASAEYAFEFQLQVDVPEEEETTEPSEAPSEPEVTLEYLTQMPTQAAAAIEAMIGGAEASPITANIKADVVYRGLLMRTAMLPYIPCEQDGNNCSGIAGMGLENLKVVAQTNGALVEFSTEIAAYDGEGWGDCFYLYVTPTEAAKAAEDGTKITGEIYFENESHKTHSIHFVFSLKSNEVISSSTSACNDAWEWTGDGDKIASLPYDEIRVDQTYVAAVCSPYWTDYAYSTEPTLTEVNFTAGEDLVTVALRVRNESTIWGGSDCVYAEITPTAETSSLTVEKTVSGTFKMYYNPWDAYCDVPFEVTLKPADATDEETPALPDPGPNTGVLRVAMGVVDITPARDVYLQGYVDDALAEHPSDFTSDLNARILILDDGNDRLVFLNLELVFSGVKYGVQNLSLETLRQIAQICHTDERNIMLSNTHNHQANMVLAQREEQHILQGVAEAYSRLAPVKIGTTTVNTQFGISRGSDYTMDANAPYDSLMSIVRFDNAETGEPIGLIYSIPLHNTMLSNGYLDNSNKVNCEFTGYASRAIEEEMSAQNPYFTAMHINGFYGNAGPYANGTYHANTVEQVKANGEAFAQEIMSGYNTIQTQTATGTLSSSFVIDSIPANQNDQSYREQFGDKDEMPLYITLGAFGDIAYVGVNYEPYSIIGARLKAESPYSTLIPAGDVNGWNGYIPTKEAATQHANGDTQVECSWYKSPFDAQAEEIFYSSVLDAICDMAGVEPVRATFSSAGITTNANEAEYVFMADSEIALDKLVISFGQNSRTDCATDFTLMVYDDQDQLVLTKDYAGNTVNYLGEFLDGTKVAKAVLKVRARYGSGAKGIDKLQPEIWGVCYSTLPAYTETISDSTDYASYGGEQWNVTPKMLEATIAPREKYTVALATSYWALPEVSGYSSAPTQLNATFTSGDGLLKFQVRLGAGPIWDGVECELLTIIPTNEAYLLEETTVVTGYIDIYWRGFTQMPFSVTIKVAEEACTHAEYEKFCCTNCGYFNELAFVEAVDLNADGKITAFDAQILAEARADLRQLPVDSLALLADLTVKDIVDYALGRYPTKQP